MIRPGLREVCLLDRGHCQSRGLRLLKVNAVAREDQLGDPRLEEAVELNGDRRHGFRQPDAQDVGVSGETGLALDANAVTAGSRDADDLDAALVQDAFCSGQGDFTQPLPAKSMRHEKLQDAPPCDKGRRSAFPESLERAEHGRLIRL